ncbi:putative mitochondrial import receptor subunit TOM7 [Plasmopara halstedii]
MARELWKTAPTKVLKTIKPIVHYGFVPLIVYIALRQEPNLTLLQIINPLAAPAEPSQV